MPLMMEETMDIDDLFGDGVDLPIPLQPPSISLYQRVDELRGIGCCQSISWSKWGSIASVAPNGYTLELRSLRRHSSNGDWALSEPPYVTPHLNQNLDAGPLKHLSWSPTGSELVVIDTAGRITILSLFSSLNKPTLLRHGLSDPAEDIHAVVGGYWLNQNPVPPKATTILHGPAVKKGSQYSYETSQHPVLGPYHPNHLKSAYVCITANGLLRVLWPQNNSKWFESHTEIESIVSSDDLITHAAICPDRTGTLLIAFVNTSKQLRVIRAHIDWGLPKGSEKIPPAALPLNPTVRTRHLALTTWPQIVTIDNPLDSGRDLSMVQLSHLEILPVYNDSNGRHTPPTIIAVRSHLPPSSSQYNRDCFSTIDRWEIREKSQAIHSAFEQVTSRRNGTGTTPVSEVIIKSLEGITVKKIAITVQPIYLGKYVSVVYHDGSIEYRDRTTLQEIFLDTNLDQIMHPSQAGMVYGEVEPCLQIAYSPSYCSMVQIKNDGKITWIYPEYQLGHVGMSMDDPQYAAVVASLGVSIATAVTNYANYDDLLAIASRYSKDSNFAYDWLMEMSRPLKVSADYSDDGSSDLLIRNSLIQFCLTIQNSLGFHGEFNARSFGGKHAWIGLQLRNIVVLLSLATQMMVPSNKANSEKQSPLDDPEVINALSGSVHWVVDLMAWITDTLITLPSNTPPDMDLTDASTLCLPDLLHHLRSTNNISLHLLLSSPMRGYLTAVLRRMASLEYTARKAVTLNAEASNTKGGLTPALRTAYIHIAHLIGVGIVRISTFQSLLSHLTTHIKTAYSSATNSERSGSGSPEKHRNIWEMKMLFGGPIPEVFKSVIVELFKGLEVMGTGDGRVRSKIIGQGHGLLQQVREEIDPAKLWFADFELLQVDEDDFCLRKRREKGLTMDCFRKTWLKNIGGKGVHVMEHRDGETNGRMLPVGARLRRCARCTATMEESLSSRQALQWLVMQQRRCFCSGFWNTIVGQSAE